MTRKQGARVAIAAALSVIVLTGCGLRNPDAASVLQHTATTGASASASAAAELTLAQIDRQDHAPAALKRTQSEAVAARPMLPALPITEAGVTIAIGGLATDGHTTILTIVSRLGRSHALAAYRHELRLYGDNGHAYKPEVQP